jgi:hypothetical protein
MVALDNALTNLGAEISPWKNPVQWLLADKNHTDSVVQGIAILTESSEIEQAKFTGAMIYQVRCAVSGY